MRIDVLPAATDALDTAQTVALPTKRDEAWRYAPHKALGELVFGSASAPLTLTDEVDAQIPAIDGPRLVIVNGVVNPLAAIAMIRLAGRGCAAGAVGGAVLVTVT